MSYPIMRVTASALLLLCCSFAQADLRDDLKFESHWITFSFWGTATEQQNGYLMHIPSFDYDKLKTTAFNEGDFRITPDGEAFSYSWDQYGWNSYKQQDVNSLPQPLVEGFEDVAFHDWAPDGDAIVFSSKKDAITWQLYVYYVNSGYVQQLTNQGNNMHADYSPDGQWIAYASDRDGDNELFALRPADGVEIRLTQNDFYDDYPVWSPDGDAIVYSSEGAVNHNARRLGLYQLGALGDLRASPVQLASSVNGDHRHPDWSYDGRYLLYLHTPDSDYSGIEGTGAKRDIRLMNVSSPTDDILILESGYFDHPRWAPPNLSLGQQYYDMYAASYTTLFQVTGGESWSSMDQIGDFGIGNMTDLAMDGDELLGIGFDSLYGINRSTGEATLLKRFSVSDLSAFAVDPVTRRMVVAGADGTIYQLTRNIWSLTPLASYGGNWGSGGDLAYLSDGTLYGSALNSQTRDEALFRIRPESGTTSMVGPLGLSQVWGLGVSRGDDIIALTNAGELFPLNTSTGLFKNPVLFTPDEAFTGAAPIRAPGGREHAPATSFAVAVPQNNDISDGGSVVPDATSSSSGGGSLSWFIWLLGLTLVHRMRP